MFDERRYRRPQIEDIELGHRVRDAGYRIVLRADIQATHLKRWTLRGMMVNDVRDRGVPWMRLLLREKHRARRGTLNLRSVEKLYTLLTSVAACALAVAVARGDVWWLLGASACVLVVIAGNAPLFRWFARRRGFWFALAIVPLRLLYYAQNSVAAAVAWLGHTLVGESAPQQPGGPGVEREHAELSGK